MRRSVLSALALGSAFGLGYAVAPRHPALPDAIEIVEPPEPNRSPRPTVRLAVVRVRDGDREHDVAPGSEDLPTWKVVLVSGRRTAIYAQPAVTPSPSR